MAKHFRVAGPSFCGLLLAGLPACGNSQSAGVVIEEEPTRGTIPLTRTADTSILRQDATLAADSAAIENPVLLVDGERLGLRRDTTP